MTQRNNGRPGRGAWILAGLALLLLPWPAARAVEKGYNPQDKADLERTGKIAAGAAGAIFPVAGPIVAKFFEVGTFLVFLGQEPEQPEIFKQINARLDALEMRLTAVEAAVDRNRTEIYKNANLARVREFRRFQRDLKGILFELGQQPNKKAREALAYKAQLIAGEFLIDTGPAARDLWMWSDLALEDHTWMGETVKAGRLYEPDFKPWPALESYSLALITWMAAASSAGEGNAVWVKQTYGQELQKHIEFVSVRPRWNPIADDPRTPEREDVPKTLPEYVEARVSSWYTPGQLPTGEAYVNEYIVDYIARQIKYVESYAVPASERGALTNVPGSLSRNKRPSWAAEELQRETHGTALMWTLADRLARLKATGSLREQFIGTFPLAPTTVPAFLYGVRTDGRITWSRHDGARVAPGAGQPEALKVAAPAGSGWDGFRHVLPGGRNVIYAVTRDGRLLWYRHSGFNFGDGKDWESGKEIAGGGWADFKQVLSGGNGVLYGISRTGRIYWYRHTGNGSGARTWEGGNEVGSGWGDFRHVFCGGAGIIYVVTVDGRLLWYKHLGYANGAKAWEGPKEIGGTGWADFKNVFSAGDGLIYAITRAGSLVRYRHTGYSTGARTWEPGREVAPGWGDFVEALALLPDSVPDRVN